MTQDGEFAVSVSRRIDAPAEKLFEVLADPGRHQSIDGSGMLRGAIDPVPVTAVGDVFAMRMYREDLGDYVMENHVVAYEPARRIAWEPVLKQAAGAEDLPEEGRRGFYVWGYELAPDGPGATIVTETYDCSRSPEWLQEATKGGRGWLDAMTRSLDRLEEESAGW